MQQFRKNNISVFARILLMGLVVGVIVQATVLASRCHNIRKSVLRLHILAHSDSPADQQLKIKVRDALLTKGGHLLQGADTKEQAESLARQHLLALTQIAEQTLRENGCQQTVTCRLAQTYFNTRTYETVTLPAGDYTALQVVIGEGNGKNWWCVMFPNLCIPAATKPQSPDSYFTPEQTDLVENEPRYQVRFKTVEWFQSAIHFIQKCF